MKKYLLIFSTLFLVWGCKSVTQPANDGGAAVHITEQDSGKLFRLKPDTEFDASFNECIGCADIWKIAEIDSSKIKFLNSKFSGNSCEDCVGGSQMHTFNFKAIEKGKTDVVFSYSSQKVVVTIDVQ